MDAKTRQQLETRYFHASFDEIWQETKSYWNDRNPREIEIAEARPKHKLSLLFRWYFGYSMRLAFQGNRDHKVNFQIHSGPAMGAFNQWVKGTPLEDWRNRHVDDIAERLMAEASQLLSTYG